MSVNYFRLEYGGATQRLTEAEFAAATAHLGPESMFEPEDFLADKRRKFLVTNIGLTGLSGPGIMPHDMQARLDGLELPIAGIVPDKEAEVYLPETAVKAVAVRPRDIVAALAGRRDLRGADLWAGYDYATRVVNEEGVMLSGVILIPKAAGRFVETADTEERAENA